MPCLKGTSATQLQLVGFGYLCEPTVSKVIFDEMLERQIFYMRLPTFQNGLWTK